MNNKILDNLEEIISSIFILITTILVLINIVTRYFFRTGIYWSEEVATGCFVWAVFIGAAAAYKKGQHIGIDVIVKHLDGRTKDTVKLFIDLLLLVLMTYMSYLSIKYVMTTYTKPTPVLDISSAYVSTSIPIGFSLMVIRTLEFIKNDIKRLGER